jgi:hypothetical protein
MLTTGDRRTTEAASHVANSGAPASSWAPARRARAALHQEHDGQLAPARSRVGSAEGTAESLFGTRGSSAGALKQRLPPAVAPFVTDTPVARNHPRVRYASGLQPPGGHSHTAPAPGSRGRALADSPSGQLSAAMPFRIWSNSSTDSDASHSSSRSSSSEMARTVDGWTGSSASPWFARRSNQSRVAAARLMIVLHDVAPKPLRGSPPVNITSMRYQEAGRIGRRSDSWQPLVPFQVSRKTEPLRRKS